MEIRNGPRYNRPGSPAEGPPRCFVTKAVQRTEQPTNSPTHRDSPGARHETLRHPACDELVRERNSPSCPALCPARPPLHSRPACRPRRATIGSTSVAPGWPTSGRSVAYLHRRRHCCGGTSTSCTTRTSCPISPPARSSPAESWPASLLLAAAPLDGAGSFHQAGPLAGSRGRRGQDPERTDRASGRPDARARARHHGMARVGARRRPRRDRALLRDPLPVGRRADLGHLCFYFAIVLRQDYPARRRAGLLAGVLGGLATTRRRTASSSSSRTS